MSKFKFLMTLWYKELLCNIKNEILISGIFCWYQHWKGITEMLLYFLKKNSYSGNKKVVVFQLPNLVSLKFLCLPSFLHSEKILSPWFLNCNKVVIFRPYKESKSDPSAHWVCNNTNGMLCHSLQNFLRKFSTHEFNYRLKLQ